MVVTYLRQRENSPEIFGRDREFPIFNDLTIVDDSDSEDEEDSVDEGIEKDGKGCTSGGGWANLPHILLEDIMSYVPQKDRYSAALVCRRWAETFSAPRVWNNVEIHANSFMCKKMRFRRTSHGNGRYQKTYVTEQKVDSPKLLQDCIQFIGRYVKCIEFFPMNDYRKIVEMLNALQSFKDEEDAVDEGFVDPESKVSGHVNVNDEDGCGESTKPLMHLRQFIFNYAFDTIETCFQGTQVLGTGGTILDKLKTTICAFKQLKCLQLHNLFLDADDGLGILNSFVGCEGLTHIDAFNLTKEATTIIDLTLFKKLETMVISPLQLTEELVSSLAESAALKRVDVAFDEYSDCSIQVVDKSKWAAVKEAKPGMELQLESRGKFHGDFPVIAHAPVTHVIYRNPTSEFTKDSVKTVIECYKTTLTCYAHVHLPCTHLTKSAADRVHAAVMELAQNCPRLTTIAVRDMIYSSSILLLLKKYPHIQTVHVRRGGILMKNIVSPVHDRYLSTEDHQFLRRHSSSVSNLKSGVDQLLGASNSWRPLTNAAFKKCLA